MAKKEFVLRVSAEIAEDLVPMLEDEAKSKLIVVKEFKDPRLAKEVTTRAKRMKAFAGKLKKKLIAWHKKNAL